MEKTDKSAEENKVLRILQNAEDYAFQVPYDGTNIFCDEKKYESYIAGAKSELKYAAQQLSEYKETIKKLLPLAVLAKITVDDPNWRELWESKKAIIDRAKKLIE